MEESGIIMDTKTRMERNTTCALSTKMWRIHKTIESKLESPKEDDTNKEEEEKVHQQKQALLSTDDEDEAVKCS